MFHYVLFAWEGLLQRAAWLKNWMNNSPETYVHLRPGADVAAVNDKIKHFPGEVDAVGVGLNLDGLDVKMTGISARMRYGCGTDAEWKG